MRTIEQYHLPNDGVLLIPKGSTVLSFQARGLAICVNVLHDPDQQIVGDANIREVVDLGAFGTFASATKEHIVEQSGTVQIRRMEKHKFHLVEVGTDIPDKAVFRATLSYTDSEIHIFEEVE